MAKSTMRKRRGTSHDIITEGGQWAKPGEVSVPAEPLCPPQEKGCESSPLRNLKIKPLFEDKAPLPIRQSHRMWTWSFGFWFLSDKESWRKKGENTMILDHQSPPTMKQALKYKAKVKINETRSARPGELSRKVRSL